MIRYEKPGDAAASIIDHVMVQGQKVLGRNGSTLEVIGSQFMIMWPAYIPFTIDNRNLNHTIGKLEALSLIGQTSNDAMARKHVKSLAAFQNDNVQWGNYGCRIRGHLSDVIMTLKTQPNTRQAVLTIYDSPDMTRNTLDVPCTTSIQFLLRDRRLDCIVTMRSNDVYLGLPYDLMQFCLLHVFVAHAVGVSIGRYIHQAGSLHLYTENSEAAMRMGDVSDYSSAEFASQPADIIRGAQDTLAGIRVQGRNVFEAWLFDLDGKYSLEDL